MTTETVDKVVDVDAPAGALWTYFTTWARHGEWIPMTRVETVGGDGRRVGGRFRAWTGLGPIGFWDPMTVTVWEEHEDGSGHCAVVHTGRVVKGDAEITVTALEGGRSRLHWQERFEFSRPAAFGWRVAERLVLDRTLDRALAKAVAIVEASSGG